MSVNEPTWIYGKSEIFNSSGSTTDPDKAWVYGKNWLIHEYVVVGVVAPTGVFNGPLVGPLGGPI